ncbi:hypothetical protein C8Q78DRAFT_320054 [Trametes maxima]|nr:hypothetical protein C8Q78DRAFT_320054 [Trametes maxima]
MSALDVPPTVVLVRSQALSGGGSDGNQEARGKMLAVQHLHAQLPCFAPGSGGRGRWVFLDTVIRPGFRCVRTLLVLTSAGCWIAYGPFNIQFPHPAPISRYLGRARASTAPPSSRLIGPRAQATRGQERTAMRRSCVVGNLALATPDKLVCEKPRRRRRLDPRAMKPTNRRVQKALSQRRRRRGRLMLYSRTRASTQVCWAAALCLPVPTIERGFLSTARFALLTQTTGA